MMSLCPSCIIALKAHGLNGMKKKQNQNKPRFRHWKSWLLLYGEYLVYGYLICSRTTQHSTVSTSSTILLLSLFHAKRFKGSEHHIEKFDYIWIIARVTIQKSQMNVSKLTTYTDLLIHHILRILLHQTFFSMDIPKISLKEEDSSHLRISLKRYIQ